MSNQSSRDASSIIMSWDRGTVFPKDMWTSVERTKLAYDTTKEAVILFVRVGTHRRLVIAFFR